MITTAELQLLLLLLLRLVGGVRAQCARRKANDINSNYHITGSVPLGK